MAKDDIKKILEDADNVVPVAEFCGIKLTTFEDGATLRKADAIENDSVDLSNMLMNEDGTVARSKVPYASVNKKKMFANKSRQTEKDGVPTLQVVIDYRAISEQNTGSVYLKNIPMYEFVRNPKSKELEIKSVSYVSDTEFMSEFINTINEDDYKGKILPLINAHGSDATAVEIGI